MNCVRIMRFLSNRIRPSAQRLSHFRILRFGSLQPRLRLTSASGPARTAWHTHPLGQALIVTSGAGWVQRWGGPVEAIRPGDVVWFEPGEKHWHGATRRSAMMHIAVQEALNGSPVDWMEQVSDEQYPDFAQA